MYPNSHDIAPLPSPGTPGGLMCDGPRCEPWMVSPDGLALRRNRCPAVLYAAIYEATGDGAGHFAETAVAFSDMHGFNRHTFQDARDRLLAAGLIERVLDEEGRPVKIRRPGRPVYLLRVNLDAAREAKERFERAFGESAPAAVAAPAGPAHVKPAYDADELWWAVMSCYPKAPKNPSSQGREELMQALVATARKIEATPEELRSACEYWAKVARENNPELFDADGRAVSWKSYRYLPAAMKFIREPQYLAAAVYEIRRGAPRSVDAPCADGSPSPACRHDADQRRDVERILEDSVFMRVNDPRHPDFWVVKCKCGPRGRYEAREIRGRDKQAAVDQWRAVIERELGASGGRDQAKNAPAAPGARPSPRGENPCARAPRPAAGSITESRGPRATRAHRSRGSRRA